MPIDLSFPESVGALIENPRFIGSYTAYKNLEIIASIQHLIDRAQIENTISLVGLDPKDTRKYRKFSLGMKQRLGIAAAIMENPQIIILDEPTNALDEAGVNLIRGILEEHKKRGAIIIIASHDKEELEWLSDEIILVEKGEIKDRFTINKERDTVGQEN